MLVSSATASLVEMELTDLGEHRSRTSQLRSASTSSETRRFLELRSLYQTNLPVPTTAFLGREQELAEIGGLVAHDSARLVTLTGPGGTGKTRLAIQAAAEVAESFPTASGGCRCRRCPMRTCWCPRSHRRSRSRRSPAATSLRGVAARLLGKRALLILDNAEHLMPQMQHQGSQGSSTPRDRRSWSRAVNASRSRLSAVYWGAVARGRRTGVELFLTRAQAQALESRLSAARVAELCSRLDNLPLAIELAAARTVVFSPEQLVERAGVNGSTC